MTDWSAAPQQAFATHVKTCGSSGSCGSSVRMPSKTNKLPFADLGPTCSKLVGLVAPPSSAGATEPLGEPRVATIVGSEKETSDQLLDRNGATGATRATREQGPGVSTQLDEERIAILETDGNIPSAYAETFARLDAVRSFREAWKRDPECAICYWGEGWAWGSYLNGAMPAEQSPFAYAAAQKALALKDKATPVERAFIEALAVRYVKDFDPDKRREQDQAYADAMQKVAEQFPADLDAATLYADALFILEPRADRRLQPVCDVVKAVDV